LQVVVHMDRDLSLVLGKLLLDSLSTLGSCHTRAESRWEFGGLSRIFGCDSFGVVWCVRGRERVEDPTQDGSAQVSYLVSTVCRRLLLVIIPYRIPGPSR
jgi:hypothetical protein